MHRTNDLCGGVRLYVTIHTSRPIPPNVGQISDACKLTASTTFIALQNPHESENMANTVILGSGIIGLSTAYYLLEHQPGSTIHLVESSPTLFASASGFAGGFLARDWFQPSVASLGALSYREHESVAEKEGGHEKWGYAKSVTVSYQPGARPAYGKDEDWLSAGSSRADAVDGRREKYHDGEIPPWLRRSSGDAVEVLDGHGGTAIVYGLFTFAVNSTIYVDYR